MYSCAGMYNSVYYKKNLKRNLLFITLFQMYELNNNMFDFVIVEIEKLSIL